MDPIPLDTFTREYLNQYRNASYSISDLLEIVLAPDIFHQQYHAISTVIRERLHAGSDSVPFVMDKVLEYLETQISSPSQTCRFNSFLFCLEVCAEFGREKELKLLMRYLDQFSPSTSLDSLSHGAVISAMNAAQSIATRLRDKKALELLGKKAESNPHIRGIAAYLNLVFGVPGTFTPSSAESRAPQVGQAPARLQRR